MLVAFQASVELLDCQLLGGDFGAGGPSCPDGLPGAAQSVAPAATFVTHAGTARGVAATSPVSEGGPTTVSLAGEAGDLVFLIIAFDTDDSLALPGFIGPGLLTFPLFLVELGFLPATGKLDLFLTVGSLAPGLEFRALYFQPIHLSAGLVLYVGGPTAMVVTGA